MSKGAVRLALACELAGLAASLAATYVHYRLLFDPLYTSFCDVNATFSCTQVYMSEYSTFRGIPVSIFGAIWFAGAALLTLPGLMARGSVRESVPGYLFAASTVALAVVLYFEYVSFMVLKAVCVLCLIMGAAVIALFFLTGATTPYPMTTLPERAKRDLKTLTASPLALAVLVLFLGGAASVLAFFPREGGNLAAAADVPPAAATPGDPAPAATPAPAPAQSAQPTEFERFMATSPRTPLVIPSEGAKVLVVKFNDFQCPACGQSHFNYKNALASYKNQPNAVRFVLKDYPLDMECNPNVTRTLHEAACEAAVAVRLAAQHNKAEELIDWLFSNQATMTPASVKQAAREVGQVPDFDAKYAATLEQVKSDIALGKQLSISATPTFFINGVRIDGSLPPLYFQQALDYEIKKAAAK